MLTNPLLIGVKNTRVSLISYSNNVRFHFKFRDYQGYDKIGLHQFLDRLYRKGKFTLGQIIPIKSSFPPFSWLATNGIYGLGFF